MCDDGSEDKALEIVSDLQKRTALFPVRFFRNDERLGYRVNFMKAAELCESPLTTFADQDNVWFPERLRKCVEAFVNDEVLLVYHNAIVVDGDLNTIAVMDKRRALAKENPPLSMDPWHIAEGFTQVFRRKPLTDFIDGWRSSTDPYNGDEREAHDQWSYFLASCLGTIVYISESSAFFRQHGENTHGWTNPAKTTSSEDMEKTQPNGNRRYNLV